MITIPNSISYPDLFNDINYRRFDINDHRIILQRYSIKRPTTHASFSINNNQHIYANKITYQQNE